MHLIQLDENNVVTSVVAIAYAPMLTPLTVSVMLSATAPEVGQTFDPETKLFSAPARRRWVSKLAFDNRFTIQEAVALKAMQTMPARGVDETDAAYVARSSTPAQLQVLQSRLNMATYIDLDREDTRQGVQTLEAMGLLGAGRALEILDGPIAEHEYHPTA